MVANPRKPPLQFTNWDYHNSFGGEFGDKGVEVRNALSSREDSAPATLHLLPAARLLGHRCDSLERVGGSRVLFVYSVQGLLDYLPDGGFGMSLRKGPHSSFDGVE